mmetsp:Transcript_1359/g.1779  ORF Transcript_1359/g.1779 Transcript_1359/m.1779 type:complete len:121 (+) Transcript_1359:147-509(+)
MEARNVENGSVVVGEVDQINTKLRESFGLRAVHNERHVFLLLPEEILYLRSKGLLEIEGEFGVSSDVASFYLQAKKQGLFVMRDLWLKGAYPVFHVFAEKTEFNSKQSKPFPRLEEEMLF